MVTKTIERHYILTPDEVKMALYDFLKGRLDQPMPSNPGALAITWNAPGEAFITFNETQEIST